jgi:hypothetical protein
MTACIGESCISFFLSRPFSTPASDNPTRRNPFGYDSTKYGRSRFSDPARSQFVVQATGRLRWAWMPCRRMVTGLLDDHCQDSNDDVSHSSVSAKPCIPTDPVSRLSIGLMLVSAWCMEVDSLLAARWIYPSTRSVGGPSKASS